MSAAKLLPSKRTLKLHPTSSRSESFHICSNIFLEIDVLCKQGKKARVSKCRTPSARDTCYETQAQRVVTLRLPDSLLSSSIMPVGL